MNITDIKQRQDGTYEVMYNGLPFHVTEHETPEVYQEVLKMIEAGAVVEEAMEPETPPVSVPVEVTLRQAKLALLTFGYYSQIDQAIKAMPGDEGTYARIEWEYATTVNRNSPLVQSMGHVLGLDGQALDDLFSKAATL